MLLPNTGKDFLSTHDDMMERTARRPNRASCLPCYYLPLELSKQTYPLLGCYDERHDVSRLYCELGHENVSLDEMI